MSAKSDYADLVAQAERAVVAVKDPELRRAAFERVLEDLHQTNRQSEFARDLSQFRRLTKVGEGKDRPAGVR
jgi:hypothetical protein